MDSMKCYFHSSTHLILWICYAMIYYMNNLLLHTDNLDFVWYTPLKVFETYYIFKLNFPWFELNYSSWVDKFSENLFPKP